MLTWLGGIIYTLLIYLINTDYTRPEVAWIHNVNKKHTEFRHFSAKVSLRNLDPLMIQLGFIEKPRLFPQVVSYIMLYLNKNSY